MKRIFFILLICQMQMACSLFQRKNYSDNDSMYDYNSSLEGAVVKDVDSALPTKRAKELFYRILPWISDEEKVDFLSLANFQEQRQWVQEKQIFMRQSSTTPNEISAIDNKDIYVGMQQEYVKKSWGEPQGIETAGNPLYRNERWKYLRQIATENGFEQQKRYVYFEDGKVVGWEQR